MIKARHAPMRYMDLLTKFAEFKTDECKARILNMVD